MRLILAFVLAALTLGGCDAPMRKTSSTTPQLDMAQLDQEVRAIAGRVGPGVLGVGLMNLDSGEVWTFNGERRFPLQGAFAAPLGAAVLAEMDAGRLRADEVLTLTDEQISPPYSPLADAWPERSNYTVDELLRAAVAGSDNTAADVLMKRIGGPGAVTAWLTDKHVEELRIDRYQRQLQPDSLGMASFRTAWKGEAAFNAAVAAIPPGQRFAASQAYLSDPQDTATPRGMLTFLDALSDGELLAPASTKRLVKLMTETPIGDARLKAGLPSGARLAHKTGVSGLEAGVSVAVNDIGIVTLPDGRSYAIAVFLAGARLSPSDADGVIAQVAQAITGVLD